MNEHCSCGAKLPDDARFCHKCGKPQFEDVPEPEPPAEPEPVAGASQEAVAPEVLQGPVTLAGPAVISLRNPLAVRYALIAAGLTGLIGLVPLPHVLTFVWNIVTLAGGGFLAVYLYHRRTGDYLTTRGGARLGYFVGLFCFLMVLVIFTLTMLLATTDQSLIDILREAAPKSNPELAKEFEAILNSPGAVGVVLVLALTTYFFFMTLLPTIGGALAAKVLEKD